ncbi:MAG: DUF5688 family protein [Lachnospiraceae bacterium]
MINYEKFQEEIQNQVRAALGEDMQLRMIQVPKNNGVVLDGMSITRDEIQISPVIYINSYYERYQHGEMTIEEIVQDILRTYEENPLPDNFDIQQLADFEQIKSCLCFKLINRERNQHLLESVPYTEVLDLAIVYYLLINNSEHGRMTALIQRQHLDVWGISIEELNTAAFENCQKEQPVKIGTMYQVLRDLFIRQLGDVGSEALLGEFLDEQENQNKLYVLTNETGINGAGGMLYSDVLEEFSFMMKADLIILPSSVHEVLLLVDDGRADYAEFKEMVTHINCTEVPTEDFLSDNIYRYSREQRSLQLVPINESVEK